MELREIWRTIWRRKFAFAVVCAIALLAGIYTTHKIGPSGLTKRGTTFGAAQTQILVDSPQSALANLKQDTIPLTTRAGVFAQLMASSAVRDQIASETGIPARQIIARGPFDDPAAAPSDAAVAPAPELPEGSVAATARYRLTFVAQEELPLVTVYAEAPDARAAAKLADAVAPAVRTHVERLQADRELPPNKLVVVRGLGGAETGTVDTAPSSAMMVVAFLFVMIMGCLVILFTGRRGRTLPGLAAAHEEPPLGLDLPGAPVRPLKRNRGAG
jgi:capsular polysaccharide biosynthesis protein